jgi:hypothetical protein
VQVDKLMKIVKAEKAARVDLEMYVAVLTTQKNVLQEDTDKVRKELHEGEDVILLFILDGWVSGLSWVDGWMDGWTWTRCAKSCMKVRTSYFHFEWMDG